MHLAVGISSCRYSAFDHGTSSSWSPATICVGVWIDGSRSRRIGLCSGSFGRIGPTRRSGRGRTSSRNPRGPQARPRARRQPRPRSRCWSLESHWRISVESRRLDDVLERAAGVIGKRTAPPPTVRLVTFSGDLAARKSAAAVPTSGPTTCGAPRPHSSISRARNCPRPVGSDQLRRGSIGVPEPRHVDRDRRAQGSPSRAPDASERPEALGAMGAKQQNSGVGLRPGVRVAGRVLRRRLGSRW